MRRERRQRGQQTRGTRRVDFQGGGVAIELARVRPVAKTALRPGVVVWAHVPFAEDEGEKTRPAVVVGLVGRTVTLLPVTSSETRRRFPHRYVEIANCEQAGLTRPCAVRVRPVEVDIIEVIEVVGELSDDDRSLVVARLDAWDRSRGGLSSALLSLTA